MWGSPSGVRDIRKQTESRSLVILRQSFVRLVDALRYFSGTLQIGVRSSYMNNLTQSDPHSVLSGWKEIAKHLGKGVRTVQRYEHDLGLPVRRPAGHSSGSVVALKSELEAWVYARPVRAASRSIPLPLKTGPTGLRELTQNLKKMRELRSEMLALRSDLQSSLTRLQANIPVPQKWTNTGGGHTAS